jgi:flagellar biosynthesis protein FlhG
VVNQSRSRADLELGDAIARVAQRILGVHLESLGPVEFDDAVPLAARRRKPLLLDAPAAKASRNLERIARRLLTVEPSRLTPTPPGIPPPAPTHYDILALDRGASDEELRRAYRKTREVWSSESLSLAGLVTEAEVSAMVARIEEARDVLLDPSRRRPYDLSITPASELRALSLPPEPGGEGSPLVEVPMPVLTPDTDYTGPLLRAVREARGIDLRDVAARTRISPVYLRAIEEEDFNTLPATVYTRGFVTEVAKLLRLDPELVVRSYLRRMRRPEAR